MTQSLDGTTLADINLDGQVLDTLVVDDGTVFERLSQGDFVYWIAKDRAAIIRLNLTNDTFSRVSIPSGQALLISKQASTGDIYVATSAGTVYQYDLDLSLLATLSIGMSLHTNSNMAILPTDSLALSNNGTIRFYSRSGNSYSLAWSGRRTPTIADSAGVFSDGLTDNIYFLDRSSWDIYSVGEDNSNVDILGVVDDPVKFAKSATPVVVSRYPMVYALAGAASIKRFSSRSSLERSGHIANNYGLMALSDGTAYAINTSSSTGELYLRYNAEMVESGTSGPVAEGIAAVSRDDHGAVIFTDTNTLVVAQGRTHRTLTPSDSYKLPRDGASPLHSCMV